MATNTLIPAAEYVRMSTEEQPNSILIQQGAIRKYASEHGYEVIETYRDPGRSGVEIKNRPGLQQLIQDVIGGIAPFKAILVFDVSRWGRFQDTDESAHYEFLCRSAGVQVHYCAEQFDNNGTLPSEIMKALKRTMAAEYSRDLANRVKGGMRWLVVRGFRVGAPPGYGLRRMLVSSDGTRKQILKPHQLKNLKSDRIVLVPGPKEEVEAIRLMFSLASDYEKTPRMIAHELNRRGIKYLDGRKWTNDNVWHILKNEKYTGANIWGRTNKPFGRLAAKLPRSAWFVKQNAFVPLVTSETFTRVQRLLRKRNNKIKKPEEFYLRAMRHVLARHGRLSEDLMQGKGYYDHRAFVRRFGSLLRAYELVGYKPSAHALKSNQGWRQLQRLKAELLNRLAELFPSQLKVIKRPGQSYRCGIELDNKLEVSVHICRPHNPRASGPRWILARNRKEDGLISLICLTDKDLTRFTDFYVVPEIGSLMKRYKVLREGHPLLRAGKHLKSLSEFYDAANGVSEQWKPENALTISGDAMFNERASRLEIAGKEIMLSRTEALIFKTLLENADATVWNSDLMRLSKSPGECFVRVHISALRKKLGRRFRKRLVTVKTKGYRYESNVGNEVVAS